MINELSKFIERKIRGYFANRVRRKKIASIKKHIGYKVFDKLSW